MLEFEHGMLHMQASPTAAQEGPAVGRTAGAPSAAAAADAAAAALLVRHVIAQTGCLALAG